jgi:D-tyrosyl-tRNA(Tyr) deacylase
MRAILQRVIRASVTVEGNVTGSINHGLLVLLGIEDADDQADIEWLGTKILNMRIFNDANGVMNINLMEAGGDILVISQFTLFASTRKGNRPSYIRAAKPPVAIPLYEQFISFLKSQSGKDVQQGVFGADMKVALVNDGPVTIIIDSKTRE